MIRRWWIPGFLLCSLTLVFPLSVSSQVSGDARTYYAEGVASLAVDDPYTAVDSFRSAIRLNPAYADARLGMAEALFLLTEYEDAYREIENARTYASGRRDLVLLEARIKTALREYESAEMLYSGILARRPHDGDANRGLAEIYALQGQRELAEEAFDLSLRYSPGDRRALLQLVILHDEAREQVAAEAALGEVLRLFPDSLEVRMQAAEHYALYEDWRSAIDHLDRARAMVAPSDSRYRRVGLLDAELSLKRGDSAAALAILESLSEQESPDVLYLMAIAYRNLGNEDMAQDRAGRLLKLDPEDEIARMFREEYLFLKAEGYSEDRAEASAWHLERGRRYEADFYYQRAYTSYRRAQLLSKTDPDVWIAYTNLIRKMGFPEHYADRLEVALVHVPAARPEYTDLQRRLDLLEHSSTGGLAVDWDIAYPWDDGKAAWNMGVYVYESGNSLPAHPESQKTLGMYFADVTDTHPDVMVPVDATGVGLEVESIGSFPEAFRDSRDRHDYFTILRFAETPRTFSASCEVYLSRSGELIGRFDELRTGQGRVSDALYALSAKVTEGIPAIMNVIGINGSRVLLDKGRWYGIGDEEPWIVIRRDSARPAIVDGGLEYSSDDFLGTVDITALSEPLCEGLYTKSGDFDFIRTGDNLYQLPPPEEQDRGIGSPDPAFRARLLAIP